MSELEPLATGTLKAIRTDCATQIPTKVEIEYAIYPHAGYDGEFVFQITKGGICGYESFIIKQNGDPLPAMAQKGWCANMGDIGYNYPRYDRLEVPASEMAKALLALSIIKGRAFEIEAAKTSAEQLKQFNQHFLVSVVPIGRAGSDSEFAEVCNLFEQFKLKYASWLQSKGLTP